MKNACRSTHAILSRKSLALTLLLFAISQFPKAQTVVWEDQFNGSTLNVNDWAYDIGDGCDIGICGWGNAELENYTNRPANVRVENGNLVIEARREDFGGKSFTSGRIKTSGRMHFKYGTLEARIKVPDLRNGLWPAFWTLGVLGNWPANGEIDMMELGSAASYPASVNNWVSAATHWENNGQQADYGLTYKSATPLTDDYHVYKLVWNAAAIRIYIDDIQYYVIDISGGAAADLEEFHNLHYILLNLAVGGNFTGITTVGGITAPMPAQMLVDYIKLTQNPGDEIVFPILPVKLTDYSLKIKENKSIVLSWTTTNEENNDHYVIERSTDGTVFIEIGIVKALGSMNQNNYSFEDQTPGNGMNYYRLVQVDRDGKKTIYTVKTAHFAKTNIKTFVIFPNPLKGQDVNLIYPGPVGQSVRVQVVDLLGKVLLDFRKKPEGNILPIRFDKRPAPGTYFVKVEGSGTTAKLVVK